MTTTLHATPEQKAALDPLWKELQAGTDRLLVPYVPDPEVRSLLGLQLVLHFTVIMNEGTRIIRESAK